jgi:hypothetical protein
VSVKFHLCFKVAVTLLLIQHMCCNVRLAGASCDSLCCFCCLFQCVARQMLPACYNELP